MLENTENNTFIEDYERIENPCPICGNELDDNGIDCTECDYLAPGYHRCPECGKITPDNMLTSYCSSCGEPTNCD